MVDNDNDRYHVPGLERGLRLLCEFSRAEPTLTAPELARRLGVPRSTVFRLLVTLESLGFVERSGDGRAYRLGLSVLRLGFEYLASLGVNELGRPILARLRDQSGYAANLVVRDGRDIIYVDRANAVSPFASTVSVGTRLPAHATVLGQVLLGSLSLSQLRGLYPEGRLERVHAGAPADVDALFARVQAIRERGYVVAEGYFEPHICTVAAPVFGATSQVVAVIGVTVPAMQLSDVECAALVAQVRDAAAELSRLLDYHDDDAGARTGASVRALRNEAA